jgi:HNH endonuclease
VTDLELLELAERMYGRPSFEDLLHVHVLFADAVQWRQLFTCTAPKRLSRSMWRRLYRAYIVSTAWRRKYNAAMERVRWQCRRCTIRFGTRSVCFAMATQVHHITYARIGDEADDDLEPICAECHKRHHAGDLSTLLERIIKKGTRNAVSP